jgi:transposase
VLTELHTNRRVFGDPGPRPDRIAVDKWHLVALANQMVTEVRQRAARELLGRRGTIVDPMWVNRRLRLTGADHLSAKQWQRLTATLERCA